MKRLTILALAGAVALGVAAHAADKPKKEKGVLQASRAGWLMGMYIGEDKNNPYPFVIQVDQDSEAYNQGVRTGDEIIRFDGQETAPIQRLFQYADNVYPGHEVTLWVRRGVDTYHFDFRMPKDAHLSPEQRQAKAQEADKNKKSKKNDKKQVKSDKGDQSGSDASADGKDKKKDKNKGPIVIKPVPIPDGN